MLTNEKIFNDSGHLNFVKSGKPMPDHGEPSSLNASPLKNKSSMKVSSHNQIKVDSLNKKSDSDNHAKADLAKNRLKAKEKASLFS